MADPENPRESSLYWGREPFNVALLTGIAILFFLAVTTLSRIYNAQQESLAARWAARGTDDLNARRFEPAIDDFRTALLYARDNAAYQLSLAQALLGLDRTDEAYAYLINLWERQPENAVVNLELARIAAGRGEASSALRFYHNSIYATWPGDQETGRRKAQLELINYMLARNLRTQAESEIIALEANVGEDPAERVQLGDLFLRVDDYDRALKAYRSSLRLDRSNAPADAGAGKAAFELGQFPEAERYLEDALIHTPDDAASESLLKTTQTVLRFDPYRPQISDAERARVTMNAYAAAGDRLKSCSVSIAPAPAGAASPAGAQKNMPATVTDPELGLAEEWNSLKPKIREADLTRDPDLVNTVMNLVFEIEKQASNTCAAPSDTDRALLLIANFHQEN